MEIKKFITLLGVCGFVNDPFQGATVEFSQIACQQECCLPAAASREIRRIPTLLPL
jgi:hypothetical protein